MASALKFVFWLVALALVGIAIWWRLDRLEILEILHSICRYKILSISGGPVGITGE